MNSYTFWLEVVKILGPAAITALITFLISRQQYNIKALELTSQSQLKAREILFTSYQKKIERKNDQLKVFVEAMTKFELGVKEQETSQGTVQAKISILQILKPAYNIWRDDFLELESELTAMGLSEKWKNQLLPLKNLFSITANDINLDNIVQLYFEFMRAAALFTKLNEELLDKKSEELFNNFIEPSKSMAKI